MAIILMVIGGFCFSGYWWLLVVIDAIILVANGGYFIDGY
jgi:hypothetical protein